MIGITGIFVTVLVSILAVWRGWKVERDQERVTIDTLNSTQGWGAFGAVFLLSFFAYLSGFSALGIFVLMTSYSIMFSLLVLTGMWLQRNNRLPYIFWRSGKEFLWWALICAGIVLLSIISVWTDRLIFDHWEAMVSYSEEPIFIAFAYMAVTLPLLYLEKFPLPR